MPFIEGERVPSRDAKTVEITDPSNGRIRGFLPAGTDGDVDLAVRSSRRAFDSGRWCDAPPSLRKRVLKRLAELIAAEAAGLDLIDAEEMGKPISVSFCNAAAAAGLVEFSAEAVDKLTGDVYTSDNKSFVAQRRVPRGVVAAIVPWNFPLFCAVLKVAPALAAGNCVVLKPSELSPRSALRLAELAQAAGLPPGTLNVVPGLGGTVGQALSLHPDVDMVAFTGSTGVGRRIMENAARSNMKVVAAECGGKSPQVVFSDGVDLDEASDAIASFLLTNQGQICSVGSRLLVHESIESEVVDRIVARFERIVMGAAGDAKTTFGPVASMKQCSRVMEYIEAAGRDGCQLVSGGKRALMDTGGYFVEPTLFRRVSPDAKIAHEEIFGPVLAVTTFRDEAEAIRIANGTPYGLAAYIWTADLSRGLRMAKAVRSSVIVNAAAPRGEGPGYAFSSEPFGQSGFGTENGLAGIEGYLRRQLTWFNHA